MQRCKKTALITHALVVLTVFMLILSIGCTSNSAMRAPQNEVKPAGGTGDSAPVAVATAPSAPLEQQGGGIAGEKKTEGAAVTTEAGADKLGKFSDVRSKDVSGRERNEEATKQDASAPGGAPKSAPAPVVAQKPETGSATHSLNSEVRTSAPVDGKEKAKGNNEPSQPRKQPSAAPKPQSPARVKPLAPTVKRPNNQVAISHPQQTQQQDPEEMDGNTFFQNYGVNPFINTSKDHFSTFAMDVDKASYAIARNYLKQLNTPPPEAVRVEEFVNFFNYHYKAPTQQAFAIYLEGAPSKFGENCQLLRIGLQSRAIPENARKKANLVFIVDTSGSMNRGGRMYLMKDSLKMLTNNLRQGDRIGIVAYNTSARVILQPTGVESKAKILAAIDTLRPGGSTNVEAGLRQGYDMASNNFMPDATNRVILCSDGVANTGTTSVSHLLGLIGKYKEDGIFLTAVGVGMGNYNDKLLEDLGDKGSGHYEYIDDIKEAERIFKHELLGTLQVVAKDAKIQVDFNPQVVASFRQLGYENRAMAHQEFRNDRKEGGQVGSGHSVTALYEVKLKPGRQGKVATVFIRYKDPDSDKPTELKQSITAANFRNSFDQASDSFKLAAAAAEFAEILRNSYWARNSSLAQVTPVLKQLSPNMRDTKVQELIALIDAARVAKGKNQNQTVRR